MLVFDKSLVIASALIPRFKLMWVPNTEYLVLKHCLKLNLKIRTTEIQIPPKIKTKELKTKLMIFLEIF